MNPDNIAEYGLVHPQRRKLSHGGIDCLLHCLPLWLLRAYEMVNEETGLVEW